MPVLQASTSEPKLRPAVAFRLTDIEREAATLLEGARARAAAIVDGARAEAKAAREEGEREGYAAGEKKGLEDGHAAGLIEGKKQAYEEKSSDVETLMQSLDAALRSFNADREDLAARAGREVPILAVAIADRVVRRAGAFDPNVCIANATAALRLVMRAHDVKLNVNPADFTLIKRTLPELQQRWPALTHVELVEDANISRGGCRVLTEGGLVDADLKEQLDRIAADLIPEEA